MITRKIITDPVEVEVTNKHLLIIRISQELSRLIIKVMITETTTPEISSPTITSHHTYLTDIKSAFDGFKSRWLPPVPLVYPQPAGFFLRGCSLTKKKQAVPPASMLAD